MNTRSLSGTRRRKRPLARSTRVADPTNEQPRPRFDGKRRLWLGDRFLHQYDMRATQTMLILTSFEEQNWCRRIDDPLHLKHGRDPKAHLRDIIHNLNQSQGGIHFFADGTGQGICWELAEP